MTLDFKNHEYIAVLRFAVHLSVMFGAYHLALLQAHVSRLRKMTDEKDIVGQQVR